MQTIQDQIEVMNARLKKVKENEKSDAAEVATLAKTRAQMKPKYRAAMDKIIAWRQRMNSETRINGMDFVSKLSKAFHDVKKGALRSNDQARAHLREVLEGMEGLANKAKNE